MLGKTKILKIYEKDETRKEINDPINFSLNMELSFVYWLKG